jgi:hypothetical protein
MRFGGHQTFSIRDGWLFKGLRMVVEDPERLADPDLADWLGVGKNMAKAIPHWLLATGLAEKDLAHGGKTKVLKPTPLGHLIWARDRYFLLPGTWWAVHVQLMNRPEHAYSWHWFFNQFSASRFERPICVEALRRHLASTGQRMPSARTLERDIACLLRSYSVSVPREIGDPEEAMECPLSELGLLLHSRQTGFFHLNRDLKPIPYHVFGYALACGEDLFGAGGRGAELDLSLTELTHRPNSPGRAFALTAEATYELIANFEAQRLVRLDGQVGERIVRIDGFPEIEWMARHYDSVEKAEEAA